MSEAGGLTDGKQVRHEGFIDHILSALTEREKWALTLLASPHWLTASAVLLHLRDDVLGELDELIRDDLVRITSSGGLMVPDLLRDQILSRLTGEDERAAIAGRLAPIFRGQGDPESRIEAHYHELALDPVGASRQMFQDALQWRSEPFFAHHLVQRLVAVWREYRARFGLEPKADSYLLFTELLDVGSRPTPHQDLALLGRIDAGDDELFAAYVGLRTGASLTLLNRLDEARRALEVALALFEKLDHRSGVATAHRLLGRIETKLDHYEGAKAHLERALELSRAAGRRVIAAQCLQGLGDIASFQGRYAEAEAHFEEAIALLESVGGRTAEANIRISFSQLLASTGELTAAGEHVRRAAKVYDVLGQKIGRANCLRADAVIELEKGNLEAADRKNAEALSLYERQDTETGEAGCAEIKGQIEQLRGHPEEALRHLGDAQRRFEEIGDTFGAANSLRDRGMLALEQQWREEAAALLMDSAERFESIGARVEAALATVLAALAGNSVETGPARATLAEAGLVLPRVYRRAWDAAPSGEQARLAWWSGGA